MGELDNHQDIMISACLITYNQESYVAQALESMLAQITEYSMEILVADDASTDQTPIILKRFERDYPGRVQIFLREKNVGATLSLYKLLCRSKGQYIACLEGDDYWIDDSYIQNQVTFLEQHKDYVAIVGRCILGDKDGNEIKDESWIGNRAFWKFDDEEFCLKDFENWKMPGHLSAAVYRNFYKETGFDGSVLYRFSKMIGDRTTLFQLCVRGKIKCHQKPEMVYRYVEEGANNWMAISKKTNRRYDEYRLICKLEDYARKQYGIKLNVQELKDNKLAAAAIVLMQNRSLDDILVFFRIASYRRNVLNSMRIAVSAVLQKRYWIKQGQPDHRVNV